MRGAGLKGRIKIIYTPKQPIRVARNKLASVLRPEQSMIHSMDLSNDLNKADVTTNREHISRSFIMLSAKQISSSMTSEQLLSPLQILAF